MSIHSNCFFKYKAATKDKWFAKILGENSEGKKMLNIDIADDKFKKFPDREKKNRNCQRSEIISIVQHCSRFYVK